MVLAASGAMAAGNEATDPATVPGAGAVQASQGFSASDLRRGADPRTSRGGDVDRETLAEQTEVQAEQRTRALAALDEKSEQRAAKLKTAAAKQAAKLRAEATKQAEAKKQAEVPATNQWVLPVAGYQLTARYGESSSLWSTVHTGLDFAAPEGTPLVAVAQGTVTEVGYEGSYGNRTIITLEDGTEVWYCHQAAMSVAVGQSVEPGDTVGSVGATGNVTGAHLHLEVRPGGGDPVDPYAALQEHNVTP